MEYRQEAPRFFKELQSDICAALEKFESSKRFSSDIWERPDLSQGYGGGGDTRVLSEGQVFERAGVNFSQVEGHLPADMSKKLVGADSEQPFFATGTSLVIHPLSPLVPTTHANFRYLEVADKCWFGGGMDLTPYYLFEEDATHFHSVAKQACDKHDENYYVRFKEWCDQYFYLPHRAEARGIGGLFFDYLGRDEEDALDRIYAFVQDAGRAFLKAYIPIVERRFRLESNQQQRDFQLLRRGRYVEFNLIYDRGTQFGLATGGRAESILMSLPPLVRWEYCFEPEPGSAEARLLEVVRTPRTWV